MDILQDHPPQAQPIAHLVPDSIPQGLRERRQWVVWKTEVRDGKPTKVPHRTQGQGRARSTDPPTWGTFAEAVARYETDTGVDGIGFVFTPEDPFIGIDIDAGADPALRDEVIRRMQSYSEISPSGNGVHIIARGHIPDGCGNRRDGIEAYDQGRYFTMTGDLLDGEVRAIRDAQGTLDTFLPVWIGSRRDAAVAPPVAPHTPVGTSPLSDDEIIERASNARNGHRFRALFDGGDVSGYGGDDSAADLALASMLTFWTQDAVQVERIFTTSALGQRDKWRGRPDYRKRTVDRALDRTERYTPPAAFAGFEFRGGRVVSR